MEVHPWDAVVLLVEDDPLYPVLVRAQLEDVWPQLRLEHASDLAGAADHLARDRFDCVLLDLGLPDGEGAGNVTRVRGLAPEVPVVVLSGHDEGELVRRIAGSGAQGHLPKQAADPVSLARAVQAAMRSAGAAPVG